MRLTLRTLLAWMDDTLSAAEVREIGKQMSESPYARELADKINRVARQRRLTVPGETGAESSDPNFVAAYLDSELSADDVAAYEKLCLTSDVNLSEVASVHQILSLIGQKAKVPPEARHRMYRLVKGRESSPSRAARAFAPSHDELVAQRPVLRPIAPTPKWGGAAAPKKSLSERFGLPVAVLGLLGVLVFAAMRSLQDEGPVRPALNNLGPIAAGPPPVVVREPAKIEAPKPDPAAEKRAADEEAARKKEAEAKAAEAAAPAVVKVEKPEGLLLAATGADGPWKPVEPGAEAKPGDRLLSLAPTWSTLQIGGREVVLAGVAEVAIKAAADGKTPRLSLQQGRILVKEVSKDRPFELDFRGKTLTVAGMGTAAVGIEVVPPTLLGTADVAPPSLDVHIAAGEADLGWGDATTKLSGPSGAAVVASDKFAERTRGKAPAWITDAGPTAFEAQVSDRLAKIIRPNRPILACLVEAREDSDKEVRRAAIDALAALGDARDLVAALNEPLEPETRAAAVNGVRRLLAKGPETRKAVRDELATTFGEGADVTEKLLAGQSPEEAKDEATVSALVPLLSAPALGTRALAIETLKSLTGRDAMEYDPAAPEGRGLAAWKELVSKKGARKAAGAGERVPPPPQPR